MSLEVLMVGPDEHDCGGVDGDTHATIRPPSMLAQCGMGPRGSAVYQSGSEKPGRCVSPGRATSTFDSCPQSPFPSPCEDTEVVGWASDDFGLLRALPLVIPASLVLWAVIAAAWIALK